MSYYRPLPQATAITSNEIVEKPLPRGSIRPDHGPRGSIKPDPSTRGESSSKPPDDVFEAVGGVEAPVEAPVEAVKAVESVEAGVSSGSSESDRLLSNDETDNLIV